MEASSTTQVVGVERESRDDHLDVAARMLDPRVRVRGEVRVLREDPVRRHELRDLHEPASRAHLRVQRIEDLRLAKPRLGQDRLAERRLPEIYETEIQGAAAVPAARPTAHRLALE